MRIIWHTFFFFFFLPVKPYHLFEWEHWWFPFYQWRLILLPRCTIWKQWSRIFMKAGIRKTNLSSWISGWATPWAMGLRCASCCWVKTPRIRPNLSFTHENQGCDPLKRLVQVHVEKMFWDQRWSSSFLGSMDLVRRCWFSEMKKERVNWFRNIW